MGISYFSKVLLHMGLKEGFFFMAHKLFCLAIFPLLLQSAPAAGVEFVLYTTHRSQWTDRRATRGIQDNMVEGRRVLFYFHTAKRDSNLNIANLKLFLSSSPGYSPLSRLHSTGHYTRRFVG